MKARELWIWLSNKLGYFFVGPVHGFWGSTANVKCIPNIPQWYINAAGNIIADAAVFALPLPAIWKLDHVNGQKMTLLGIFSLDFL